MEPISIEGTTKTPTVKFDAGSGKIEIKGRSIPENSIEFYKPLVDWLEEYAKNPMEKTAVNVQLEYFNTSSSKCILDVFKKLEAIHKAKTLSQKMKAYGYVRRWVENCQIRLWTAQGNLETLDRWTQESGLSVDDELTFLRDIEHIILARALVALGRAQPGSLYLKDAVTLLARLLKMTQAAEWIGKTIKVLVLQAVALQATGEIESALNALENALALAKPEGYVRTFVDEGEPMADLLQMAKSQGICRNYVEDLLVTFDITTMEQRQMPTSGGSSSAIGISRMVEPLSGRELEVLRLLDTDLSGPEIAQELTVTLSTVRYHTNNIYNKLSVHNRREAVSRGKQLGLFWVCPHTHA